MLPRRSSVSLESFATVRTYVRKAGFVKGQLLLFRAGRRWRKSLHPDTRSGAGPATLVAPEHAVLQRHRRYDAALFAFHRYFSIGPGTTERIAAYLVGHLRLIHQTTTVRRSKHCRIESGDWLRHNRSGRRRAGRPNHVFRYLLPVTAAGSAGPRRCRPHRASTALGDVSEARAAMSFGDWPTGWRSGGEES